MVGGFESPVVPDICYNRLAYRICSQYRRSCGGNSRGGWPWISRCGGQLSRMYVTISKSVCISFLRHGLGAGVPLTSPRFYGFSDTDDFRQAMLYVAHLYPYAPLLGLGFSLGAHILTRYVAEEGELCRLASACALACVCTSSLFTHFFVC